MIDRLQSGIAGTYRERLAIAKVSMHKVGGAFGRHSASTAW
jgi:hypothetical protein